jgi:endoglucanase
MGDRTKIAIGDGTYLNGAHYLRGVNVYSLHSQKNAKPGTVVGDSQASYDFLASRGFDIVRLAVPWSQLQPIAADEAPSDAIKKPVSTAYLDLIEQQVDRAARAGMRTVIDLHNGCTYPWGTGTRTPGYLICGDGISTGDVDRVWRAISDRFKDDKRVAAYNLFNEPRMAISVPTYHRYVQSVIDTLRENGDDHTVWVDAILGDDTGTFAVIAPNGPSLSDPADAIVYSQHFYLRNDEQPADLFARLTLFGDWCTKWKVHCAIGEVGWRTEAPASVDAVFDEFYTMADQYQMDVTYFAASSRANAGTLIAYGPAEGHDGRIEAAYRQATIIEKHLGR